jgi:hypothetical protein
MFLAAFIPEMIAASGGAVVGGAATGAGATGATTIAAGIAGAAILTTSGDSMNVTKCQEKECPPCEPLKGTLCWQEPHTEHEHKGMMPHYHTHQMNQHPTTCECRWNKKKAGEFTFSTEPTGMAPCSSYGYMGG